MGTLPSEACIVVRHDPDLSTAFGEPADLAVTYEQGDDGEPVMVVTFGPVPLTGDQDDDADRVNADGGDR